MSDTEQNEKLTSLRSKSVHFLLDDNDTDGDDRDEIDEKWGERVQSIDQHVTGHPEGVTSCG